MLGSLFAGSIAFFVFYLLLLVIALLEFYRLLEDNGLIVHKFTALFASILLFVLLFGYSSGQISSRWLGLMILFPPFMMITELYRKKGNPFNNLSGTFFGIIYVALPLCLLSIIVFPGEVVNNHFYPGILAGIFILIMVNDTAAFLIGVPFGRHRLFKRVSPKKSWEGTIGGGIVVLIAAFFMSELFPLPERAHWLVLGFLVLVFGTYGDLAESQFKRGLGIKDSGKILPGHGGVLDRIDAWFFVIPAVLVYLNFIF